MDKATNSSQQVRGTIFTTLMTLIRIKSYVNSRFLVFCFTVTYCKFRLRSVWQVPLPAVNEVASFHLATTLWTLKKKSLTRVVAIHKASQLMKDRDEFDEEVSARPHKC